MSGCSCTRGAVLGIEKRWVCSQCGADWTAFWPQLKVKESTMPSTICMGKKYRTRDGWNVRVLCVDAPGPGSVVGIVDRDDCTQYTSRWRANGELVEGMKNRDDLVEVRTRIKREVWLNVYDDGSVSTSEEVQKAVSPIQRVHDGVTEWVRLKKTARVKVTIDCEEGEGL